MTTYSYHNHTARCKHAVGLDRDYVLAAIEAGYESFGFSDHTPLPQDAALEVRMSTEQIAEYCASLTALREEFRGRIDLRIGFEAEYYPSLFDQMLALYQPYPIDYMILGQHGIGRSPADGWINSFLPHDDPALLTRYVDQTIAALSTRLFSCFAHPDVFWFTGDRDFCRQEYARLIEAACRLEVPLELNLLGLCGRRHYPDPLFWEVASRYSPRVVLGRDAHSPSRVYNGDELTETLRFADRYALSVMEEPFPLISPRR